MKVIIFRKIGIALLIGYSILTATMLILDNYPLKTNILMGLSALGCLIVAISQIVLLYGKKYEPYRDKII